MVIDKDLSTQVTGYMKELYGQAIMSIPAGSGGGSEDFAFISHKVPTVSLFMAS